MKPSQNLGRLFYWDKMEVLWFYQAGSTADYRPPTTDQISITKFQIPPTASTSTNYPLQTTDHRPPTKFQAPNSKHQNPTTATATAYCNCHYPLQTTDYRPQTPDQIPSTKHQIPHSTAHCKCSSQYRDRPPTPPPTTNYLLFFLFLDLSIRGFRTRFRIQDIRKLTTAPKEARKTVMTISSIPIKLRDDRKVPPAVPNQMGRCLRSIA